MTQPPPNPPNPNLYPKFPLMWNPHKGDDYNNEEDSWEVRAFAEDTASAMGTTWPPRSYTCSFCQREFRSAQALGGHMNVHRRDRARLQLAPPPISRQLLISSPHSCNYVSNLPSPLELFENRAGFCLVCQQLGSPSNGVLVGVNAPVADGEPYLEMEEKGSNADDVSGGGDDKEAEVREVEVDLELRLGN